MPKNVSLARLRFADHVRPHDVIGWPQGPGEPLALTEALVAQRADLDQADALLRLVVVGHAAPGARRSLRVPRAQWCGNESPDLGAGRHRSVPRELDPCAAAQRRPARRRRAHPGQAVAGRRLHARRHRGFHASDDSAGARRDRARQSGAAGHARRCLRRRSRTSMSWSKATTASSTCRIPSPPPWSARWRSRWRRSFPIARRSSSASGRCRPPWPARFRTIASSACTAASYPTCSSTSSSGASSPTRTRAATPGAPSPADCSERSGCATSPNAAALVDMRSADYTHNIAVTSALAKFHTINSAIEVDLSGQANAEIAGGRYLGAVGGQIDFVRAGVASPGGRSIIAFPSTTPGRQAFAHRRVAPRSPRHDRTQRRRRDRHRIRRRAPARLSVARARASPDRDRPSRPSRVAAARPARA